MLQKYDVMVFPAAMVSVLANFGDFVFAVDVLSQSLLFEKEVGGEH